MCLLLKVAQLLCAGADVATLCVRVDYMRPWRTRRFARMLMWDPGRTGNDSSSNGDNDGGSYSRELLLNGCCVLII